MTEQTKDWGKFKAEHEAEEHMQAEESPAETTEQRVDTDTALTDEAALEHPAYLELQEKLTEIEQKAHEQRMRLTADMDNLRSRMERDIAKAYRYGPEKLLKALVPVMDSLEQAEQLAEQHGDTAMHEGLALTMKLFLDVLEKADVQQLNPVGEVFNPEQHEAMAMQESADAAPNTVISVFQKGYLLNDRVIRAARVIVAKEKAN